jgi:hypothetical protein
MQLIIYLTIVFAVVPDFHCTSALDIESSSTNLRHRRLQDASKFHHHFGREIKVINYCVFCQIYLFMHIYILFIYVCVLCLIANDIMILFVFR